MRKLIYLIVASLAFAACEKIVEVDLPSEENRLVIEGQITSTKEPWKVRLTSSQPYFNQNEATTISNAIVRITGTDGQDILLSHTDTGMFVSDDSLTCTVGESYTLNVSYDGQSYEATEELNQGFDFDTLATYFLPDNNGFIQSGYYIFIQGKENPETGDYYLFNAYKNDTLQSPQLDSDEFGSVSYLNENFDAKNIIAELALGKTPRPFPFTVEPGDSIRVEQFVISRAYYQFLIDLSIQQGRSGSPFDSPPANPNNNLSNGALGFFSVAHKVSEEMVVPE